MRLDCVDKMLPYFDNKNVMEIEQFKNNTLALLFNGPYLNIPI